MECLCSDDFAKLRAVIATRGNLVTQTNLIIRIWIIFKYAKKDDLIEREVKYGASFDKPERRAIRRQRRPKMFENHEIRKMLAAANPVMKAMILLGINCGFGNGDVCRLSKSNLDLKSGWVDYPRPKTGVDRRIPLWAETVDAIREDLRVRPKPESKDLEDRVFLTRSGGSYWKESTSYLSEQFGRFLKSVDSTNKRGGRFTPCAIVLEQSAIKPATNQPRIS